MAEQMTGAYDNPYKFNAKELDAETGFYYYGARYYNPKWSQWYGVDPLAEKMPSWSPYVYTFDNPIRFIDPTGMIAEDTKSPNDWVYNRKTNSIYWNDKALSQSTAGANETYLGKSGTYTTQSGSTTALNSDGSHTNNSLLGRIGIYNNLDPLIKAGESGPMLSAMAFGDPFAPTISSPSLLRGKSQFDIVMVDTNPLMPAIASAVCPPCGYAAGIAQTTNDFSEGNYVSGTIGAVTLGMSSKFGSKFVHGEYNIMTKGLPKNGEFQYGIRNTETNFQFRFERHRLQTAGGGEKAVHFNYGTEGSKHFFPVNASRYRPYVRQ